MWCKKYSSYRASMCFHSLTFAHVLSDNVNGLLRHHSIELHQLVMAKFLHDLSLFQERLRGHGAWLQGLYCHLCGAIPCTWHTHTRTHIVIEKERTLIPIQITLHLTGRMWQPGVNSETWEVWQGNNTEENMRDRIGSGVSHAERIIKWL